LLAWLDRGNPGVHSVQSSEKCSNRQGECRDCLDPSLRAQRRRPPCSQRALLVGGAGTDRHSKNVNRARKALRACLNTDDFEAIERIVAASAPRASSSPANGLLAMIRGDRR